MNPPKFSFIRYTALWFLFSGILILIGLGAMVSNKIRYGRALELGIDFTGGTLIELKFDEKKEDPTGAVKSVIDSIVPGAVNQITVTDKDTMIVQSKDLTNVQYEDIKKSLKEKMGNFEEIRFTTIGPKIGDTLKRKAMIAILIALVAIVLYLAYAFRHVPKRVSPWRFGICAIAALVHDMLITIGFFALMNYEVDALFITALLTIIGFSVHDTIVVFDRIRENLKTQGRDDTFGKIADISLNQTLSRSINTSMTTVITLIALYVFGAESLKIFVSALIVGITVGTYSSIFIASPLLTLWQERSRLR